MDQEVLQSLNKTREALRELQDDYDDVDEQRTTVFAMIAYFYGYAAYKDCLNDELLYEEGLKLIEFALKMRSSSVVDTANATRAAGAEKPRDFKKAMKPYTDLASKGK